VPFRKNPVVAVAAMLCLFAIALTHASAQQPGPAQGPAAALGAAGRGGGRGGGLPMIIHPITDTVSWVYGPPTSNNSNNGIIIGRSGVILFDTKNTVEDEKTLLTELAKITTKPVTTVIISHSDGDHINGLPALPKGLTIIAQEYCKKSMEDSIARGGPEMANPDYLPTKTFDKKESLTIDGVRLELIHFAPSHTGGDTILYLPGQKIVFMGDVIHTEQPYPVFHMDNGGSPLGMVESLKGMLALDANFYVSGHGPMGTKVELRNRLATYEDTVAKVKALVAQGKSLAEVKEALGLPAPPPGGRGGGADLRGFTDNLYLELTQK